MFCVTFVIIMNGLPFVNKETEKNIELFLRLVTHKQNFPMEDMTVLDDYLILSERKTSKCLCLKKSMCQ